MTLAASPAPEMDISMTDSLDSEIANLRASIQTLTAQRRLLTSSLLASTKVQSQLFTTSTPPLNLTNIQEHSASNIHRLAFGVTSFPFTDPSPELQSKNPLLGVRIDICNRHGKFDSPYYIFCVPAGEPTARDVLRIHRHTIPALVPLEQYEREYLPLRSSQQGDEEDEGYAGSDDSRHATGSETVKQDLHALVAKVRHDLVSWRLRQDTADCIREELGLSRLVEENTRAVSEDKGSPANPDSLMQESDDDPGSERDEGSEPTGKFNVTSLTALDTSARQLRIIWSDDQVGRLKITDTGKIEKAVVIGEDGNRARDVERILVGDNETDGASVATLVKRLEIVYNKSMAILNEPEASAQPVPKRRGRKKRKS